MKTHDEHLAHARKYGFDRIGVECSCSWGSDSHGDTCPEHGTAGEAVLTEVEELRAELAAERERADKLQAFKTFVHARLDSMGVPAEFPDGPHTKEGCRIGDRMEWLEAWRMELLRACQLALEALPPVAGPGQVSTAVDACVLAIAHHAADNP